MPYPTTLSSTTIVSSSINPDIRSLKHIPRILGLVEHKLHYRPLRELSHSLDYFFFGLNPHAYHVANLLYHLLNACLVYRIIRYLSGHPRIALLGAVLFATHPVQTEAVAYISGRRDVLFALFYLFGFDRFLCYRESQRTKDLVLVFIAFILGLFTKEMAITLPLQMFAYDWLNHFPTGWSRMDRPFFRALYTTSRTVIRQHAIFYLALLALAALFALYILYLRNPVHAGAPHIVSSPFLLALTMCRVLVTYIRLLCFPLVLNADYSYNAFPITQSPLEPAALAAILLLAAIALLLLHALKRKTILAFCGLWLFLLLLPVSQIVPHHELMAEHHLYLPAVGFCLLLALACEHLRQSLRRPTVVYVIMGVVILGYAVRTVVRNPDWRNNQTLWEKTVQTAPQSSRAHTNLAVVYAKQGAMAEAIAAFRESLRISPGNVEAQYQLGNAYVAEIRLDEARSAYQRAITLKPDFAPAHFRLGQVLQRQGRDHDALAAFRRTIQYRPTAAEAWRATGIISYDQNQLESARNAFLRLRELKPDDLPASYNLGVIYRRLGQPNRAITAFHVVLRLDPDHLDALLEVGKLYLKSPSQRRLALKPLRRALELAPNQPQASTIKAIIDSLQPPQSPGTPNPANTAEK